MSHKNPSIPNILAKPDFQFSWESEACQLVHHTDWAAHQIEQVYHWRNHIEVRKWMFDATEFSLEEHQAYFKNSQTSTQKSYWIIQEKQREIGVISLIINKNEAYEWGFYLNPTYFGTGLSIHLVYHALNFFFDRLKLPYLIGYVNAQNKNALCVHDLFEIHHQSFHIIENASPNNQYSLRKINAADWKKQATTISALKRKLVVKRRRFY